MDDFSIAHYLLLDSCPVVPSIQDRAQEEELALEQACCRCFLGADEANRSQGCRVKMFRVFSFQGATFRIDMNWQSWRLVDQGSRIGWWIRSAGFLGTCEWFQRKIATTSLRCEDPVILQEGFWYWLQVVTRFDHPQEVTRSEGSQGVQVSNDVLFSPKFKNIMSFTTMIAL